MDGITFTVASPERLAMSNPFDDMACVSVDLGKEINVTQLADEIGARAGYPVMLAMIISETAQPRLYVRPVVDEETITQAINDHEIDDMYGLSDERRERNTLIRKLSSGEGLTTEEMLYALRLALASG